MIDIIHFLIKTLGGKEYKRLLEQDIELIYNRHKITEVHQDKQIIYRNRYVKLQTEHLILYGKYHTFGEVTDRRWWL